MSDSRDRGRVQAHQLHGWRSAYFFLVCASADPAADFEAAPVLPSLKTAEAALAALAEVAFGGET
jgi:hypothetical protein